MSGRMKNRWQQHLQRIRPPVATSNLLLIQLKETQHPDQENVKGSEGKVFWNRGTWHVWVPLIPRLLQLQVLEAADSSVNTDLRGLRKGLLIACLSHTEPSVAPSHFITRTLQMQNQQSRDCVFCWWGKLSLSTCPRVHRARFKPRFVTSSLCSSHDNTDLCLQRSKSKKREARMDKGQPEQQALVRGHWVSSFLHDNVSGFPSLRCTWAQDLEGSPRGRSEEEPGSCLGASPSKVWGRGRWFRRQATRSQVSPQIGFPWCSSQGISEIGFRPPSPTPSSSPQACGGSLNKAQNCQFSRNGNKRMAGHPVYTQLSRGLSFGTEESKQKKNPKKQTNHWFIWRSSSKWAG